MDGCEDCKIIDKIYESQFKSIMEWKRRACRGILENKL
jgi:hypothetical protein